MNGLSDGHGVGNYLNGQDNLANNVASTRAAHALAVAMRFWWFMDSGLTTSWSWPLAIARPEAVHWGRPFFNLIPCALAESSVNPNLAVDKVGHAP